MRYKLAFHLQPECQRLTVSCIKFFLSKWYWSHQTQQMLHFWCAFFIVSRWSCRGRQSTTSNLLKAKKTPKSKGLYLYLVRAVNDMLNLAYLTKKYSALNDNCAVWANERLKFSKHTVLYWDGGFGWHNSSRTVTATGDMVHYLNYRFIISNVVYFLSCRLLVIAFCDFIYGLAFN